MEKDVEEEEQEGEEEPESKQEQEKKLVRFKTNGFFSSLGLRTMTERLAPWEMFDNDPLRGWLATGRRGTGIMSDRDLSSCYYEWAHARAPEWFLHGLRYRLLFTLEGSESICAE